MSAGAWGYVIGSGLIMFLFFLILLGLFALVPPLRQRFPLRNVLAWIVSSLLIGYLTASGGAPLALLVIASLLSAILVGLRYWYVTRKQKAEPSSAGGQP